MLRKTGKHLSVLLGILFFVAIAGGLWYLASNHSRKNEAPVKIYRVTQPAKKSISDPLVQTDKESASIQPEVSETADARTHAASVPTPSDTMEVSASSDELGSQNTDAGSPIPQQSDETLAKERTKQEIAELEADIRRNEALVRELQNELANSSDSKGDSEARQRALAKQLNALSAEEQRAFFEEKAAASTKIISAFHEKLRSNPGRNFEKIQQLITSMQQLLPDLPAEERMKQHVENLRKYGFEPKF